MDSEIIDNYYDKLLHLFRDRKDKDLRHKVVRCLGRLSYICQENNDTATTKELYDLFVSTFFDLSENPTIVNNAFENMQIWKDEKATQEFIERLFENSKSNNEVIRTRCLKYLEEKILPVI